MILGSHVNFGTDQLLGCAKQATSYGANTFMFYTGAPQNTIRKSIDEEKLSVAKIYMEENNIDIKNVICHAPYIINLANKEKLDSWEFSIDFLKKEIERITLMNIGYIVVHPGNALKQERSIAIKNISDALNQIITDETIPMVLLETMAGKGTECGKDISEIKEILRNVKRQDKVGVCLDTCHLNDSGVDINKFNEYLNEFDKEIGLDKIKCIHVNDSKNELGAKKDRHANIGYGTIGFDNLISVIYEEKLKSVPKILETPWISEYPPYYEEIKMIKEKAFNPNLEKDVINHYK